MKMQEFDHSEALVTLGGIRSMHRQVTTEISLYKEDGDLSDLAAKLQEYWDKTQTGDVLTFWVDIKERTTGCEISWWENRPSENGVRAILEEIRDEYTLFDVSRAKLRG